MDLNEHMMEARGEVLWQSKDGKVQHRKLNSDDASKRKSVKFPNKEIKELKELKAGDWVKSMVSGQNAHVVAKIVRIKGTKLTLDEPNIFHKKTFRYERNWDSMLKVWKAK